MDIFVPQYMCYWYNAFQSNLEHLFRKLERIAFDGAVIPLVHPQFPREFSTEFEYAKDHEHFTRSALITSSVRWNDNAIFKITDSVDCESIDNEIRRNALKTVEQELKLAQHITPNKSILVRLKSRENLNLARIISRTMKNSGILVEVPLIDPQILKQKWIQDDGGDRNVNILDSDTWTWLNDFRMACDPDVGLSVALDINVGPEELPPWKLLRRWLGETISWLILPTFVFEKNEIDNFVLREEMKIVVELIKSHRVNFMLKAANGTDLEFQRYSEAVKYLTLRFRVDGLRTDHFEKLDKPLQPISEEISNARYSRLERDPVKYKLYQRAVEFALLSRPEGSRLAVLIAPAGRGALVRAVTNAGHNTKRKLKLYLVESNKCVALQLKILCKELWNKRFITAEIEVIQKDIRDYDPPEQLDMLVTDFIGSFGDNHLYPECIHPLQKYLNPNVICIPSKVTSYLNPIMSTLQHCRAHEKGLSVLVGTPYEVYNIAEPKAVFDYMFPNVSVEDFERHRNLVFQAEACCLLQGFLGYFECQLYDDIVLSIVPNRFTLGMRSWAPFYFPIESAIPINESDQIEVDFWRCTTDSKMWYEWYIRKPSVSLIQNFKGNRWAVDKR